MFEAESSRKYNEEVGRLVWQSLSPANQRLGEKEISYRKQESTNWATLFQYVVRRNERSVSETNKVLGDSSAKLFGRVLYSIEASNNVDNATQTNTGLMTSEILQ